MRSILLAPAQPVSGIVVIAGKPGSGKSLLMARMLAAEWQAGSAVVLFDPTGDLCRYMRDFGVPAAMLEPVHPVSAVSTGRERVQAWKRGEGIPPVVVLYSDRPTLLLELSERWIQIATDMKAGVCYGCDEAELLFPSQAHSSSGLGPSRAALLTLARNRHCRLYLASKRPQRLHVDARENAEHVCVFRSDSERFVEGCANFGRPDDYEPAMRLERGEYLYRAPFVRDVELPRYDGLADGLPFQPLAEES